MESTKDYEIILNTDPCVMNNFILKYKILSDYREKGIVRAHYREIDIYNIFLNQLKNGLGINNESDFEKLRESVDFKMIKTGIDIKFDYNDLVLRLLVEFESNNNFITIEMRVDGNEYNREADKKMFIQVAENTKLELFAFIKRLNEHKQ